MTQRIAQQSRGEYSKYRWGDQLMYTIENFKPSLKATPLVVGLTRKSTSTDIYTKDKDFNF